MSATAIKTTLPQNVAGGEAIGTQTVRTISRLVSIKRRLDDEKRPHAGQMHRLAAPIAAAVLDAYGKDDAAAALLQETKQHVSDIRAGLRGLALWQLVALLVDSREACCAFVELLCQLHGDDEADAILALAKP